MFVITENLFVRVTFLCYNNVNPVKDCEIICLILLGGCREG